MEHSVLKSKQYNPRETLILVSTCDVQSVDFTLSHCPIICALTFDGSSYLLFYSSKYANYSANN